MSFSSIKMAMDQGIVRHATSILIMFPVEIRICELCKNKLLMIIQLY